MRKKCCSILGCQTALVHSQCVTCNKWCTIGGRPNPTQMTHSPLERAYQCFDVQERTILLQTNNMGTLYRQRKCSTTTNKATKKLLCIHGYQQGDHLSAPIYDFVHGPENPEADDAPQLQHLTNCAFVHHFGRRYLHTHSWLLWTPP